MNNSSIYQSRQDLFLRDMLNGQNTSSNTSSDENNAPSVQLTKVLHPFQLYTKKRTDINNNSVEISLMGKTIEHTSLDVNTDHSVSVYLAEDGLSAGSSATANNLIKKMLPITFSSVKKNDKVSVISCNGRTNPQSTVSKNTLNSNQPPKVSFRVKSHGKGCNGTVKLFVMPFTVTDDVTKFEEHYFLMIKAKRNSLGKGNNKYGIENAYMFQKSMDNDLIDQIIDRVQAFDATSAASSVLVTKGTSSTLQSSSTDPITTTLKQESPNSKKRRVRSSSNAIQNEANNNKMRKTIEGSVREEKQIPSSQLGNNNNFLQQNNMFQVQTKSASTAPMRPTTTRSIISQGTAPLSHFDFNQSSQRLSLPQTFTNISAVPSQNNSQQQQSSASQLAMMVMMQNNQNYQSTNNNNNNMWNNNNNNTMYQQNSNSQNSNTNAISNLGSSMKNHILDLDYQKQFRPTFQPQQQQQQQTYQPIQYYQAPTQSYNDNRAIKRTLDEIFSEDFGSNMQFNNNFQNLEMPSIHNFTSLPVDDDIMSVRHQEIVEIIDSIQMFDVPLGAEDEEPLNFFC